MHNIKDIVLIPDWDTCTTEQPTSLKNGEKCLYFMYQLKLVLKNSNLNHNVLYMTYQNVLIVNCPELSAELLVLHTPLWKVQFNWRYDEQLRPENLIIALFKKGSPLKGNPIRLKSFVNA